MNSNIEHYLRAREFLLLPLLDSVKEVPELTNERPVLSVLTNERPAYLFSSSDMSVSRLRCHFSAWLNSCLRSRMLVWLVLRSSSLSLSSSVSSPRVEQLTLHLAFNSLIHGFDDLFDLLRSEGVVIDPDLLAVSHSCSDALETLH